MLSPNLWFLMAVLIVLMSSRASAQTVADSFDELRQVLRPGQMVVVTEASGRRTKGRVTDVSSSSLVVLVPEARTFAEGTVTEVRKADPLSNGALLGAGIGTGLAMWDYLIDPSEPGNAAIFTVAIGLGAAIGAGVDRLVKGKVLYASPRQTPSVVFSPFLARGRQGALVSVCF